MTFIEPCLMDLSVCITQRYDAGICKHRKERTGVIEVYEISKEEIKCLTETKQKT